MSKTVKIITLKRSQFFSDHCPNPRPNFHHSKPVYWSPAAPHLTPPTSSFLQFFTFFSKTRKNRVFATFSLVFEPATWQTRPITMFLGFFGDSSPRNCEMRTKWTRSRNFSVTKGKSGGASWGKMRGSNHFWLFSFNFRETGILPTNFREKKHCNACKNIYSQVRNQKKKSSLFGKFSLIFWQTD